AGHTTTVVHLVRLDSTGPTRPGHPMAGRTPLQAFPTLRRSRSTDAGAGVASYRVLRSEDDGEAYAEGALVAIPEARAPFPMGETTRFRIVALDAMGDESPAVDARGCEVVALDDLAEPVDTTLRVQVLESDGQGFVTASVSEVNLEIELKLVDPQNGIYRS